MSALTLAHAGIVPLLAAYAIVVMAVSWAAWHVLTRHADSNTAVIATTLVALAVVAAASLALVNAG